MRSAVAVYEAVDDGADFVFRDFNQAAATMEQIDVENILGRRVTEVFPGVAEFGLLEVFERVWRTGNPESHPVSFYRDDRIVGWRENTVYRLPNGEIVAIYDDLARNSNQCTVTQIGIDLLQRTEELADNRLG